MKDNTVTTTTEANNTTTNIAAEVTYVACISCQCGYKKFVVRGEHINKRCPICKTWLNVRLFPNMDRYVKGLDSTASGNDTVDINDETATSLRGLAVEDAFFKATETLQTLPRSLWFSKKMNKEFVASGKNLVTFFSEKWAERNVGMQRMNVGNVVRAAIKRSQDQGE
jgi:hypothetical protein